MFSKLLVTRKMPIKTVMGAPCGSACTKTVMGELDPLVVSGGSLPSSTGAWVQCPVWELRPDVRPGK